MDACTSCADAKGSHVLGISAKVSNVISHPDEGIALVDEAKIAWDRVNGILWITVMGHFWAQVLGSCKAQHSQAVIDLYQYDRMTRFLRNSTQSIWPIASD